MPGLTVSSGLQSMVSDSEAQQFKTPEPHKVIVSWRTEHPSPVWQCLAPAEGWIAILTRTFTAVRCGCLCGWTEPDCIGKQLLKDRVGRLSRLVQPWLGNKHSRAAGRPLKRIKPDRSAKQNPIVTRTSCETSFQNAPQLVHLSTVAMTTSFIYDTRKDQELT